MKEKKLNKKTLRENEKALIRLNYNTTVFVAEVLPTFPLNSMPFISVEQFKQILCIGNEETDITFNLECRDANPCTLIDVLSDSYTFNTDYIDRCKGVKINIVESAMDFHFHFTDADTKITFDSIIKRKHDTVIRFKFDDRNNSRDTIYISVTFDRED